MKILILENGTENGKKFSSGNYKVLNTKNPNSITEVTI